MNILPIPSRPDFLFVLLLCLLGVPLSLQAQNKLPEDSVCRRVVSLSPSVTETIYALGLEDRLVGVSRYCNYPQAARSKPRVGGFLDINYEALLRAKPSLVILLAEHKMALEVVQRFNIQTLTVDHRSVAGIMDSLQLIGKTCREEQAAGKLHARLQRDIDTVTSITSTLPKVRTMVAVGRAEEQGLARNIFVSGQDGFYSDILRLAGGENVYAGSTVSVPGLSVEGMLRLNPDVIVEIIPRLQENGWKEENIVQGWQEVPLVAAVQAKRIHIITAGYSEIPGPRFVSLLRDFARILHPDAAL